MNKAEYDLLQNKVKESGQTQQAVVIHAIAGLKIASAEEVDGNCIEHGDTERDYVVKDALGRVLKESAYSEMDDYLTVKEYTYNEKGWLETCVSSDDNKVSYDYPETDDRGNWTRMVITLNGQPYGIAERSITYYE